MSEWWTHLLRAFSWKWVFENEMFRWESGYLFLFFLWWKDCRGDLAIVNTFCGFSLPWIAPDKKIAEEEGYIIWCKIFLWERTLARNLWFLFPLALVLLLSSHHEKVIKWHFFCSKRGIGWKDHHLSEIWQCFLSNNDVFTLKSWQLESERTRVRGKRNHKFRAPR